MAALPNPISPTVAAIFASYEARAESPRPHLGASVIGQPCTRQLWYGFRWCTQEAFSGRMLRLFERGQREEEIFARELRAVGVEVHTLDPRTGAQFRFSVLGGHVGGSMDAALRGILEAPATWHVGEFKTHNAKSFAALQAKGVQAAKPAHYAQMQLYMHWSGMQRAFYLAVNKDTDDLYAERVRYSRDTATALEGKAQQVVQSAEPPFRISQDPAWYECKFCPAHALCHGDKLPAPNCRNCLHATPEMDGNARWSCALHRRDLDTTTQAKGCDQHRYIPALVSYAEAVDACPVNNWVEYRFPDGFTFRNGSPEMGGYSSAELFAAPPEMMKNQDVQRLRAQGAKFEPLDIEFTESKPDPDITYRWRIDGNSRHLGCYLKGRWRHWVGTSHPDYAAAVAEADAALEQAA